MYELSNVSSLLKQAANILVQGKVHREEMRQRGESFNIFDVLGLSISEVRLHSAFLGELLNPKGEHGLEDCFLKAFVEDVIYPKNKDFSFDTTSAQVFIEHYIGEVSQDSKEGGRIDIMVQDKNGHTIIIENKIYAKDQPFQMLRYNNYATKTLALKPNQLSLLYLTIDGNEPTSESKGECNFLYSCISYKEDILKWLEHCLAISALYPIIRETIRQYIINLKNTASIMENTNEQKLLSLLTSTDNIETTLDIVSHWSDIQCEIRQQFAEKIKAVCMDLGFTCTIDDGIKNASDNSWIRISQDDYSGIHFLIGVIVHKNIDGFRMGFTSNKSCNYENANCFWIDGEKPCDEYPLGWIYLWSETGKQNSGRWWRWDDVNTLRDMVNGKMLNYIKQQLVDIKEKKAFQTIKDMQKSE